MKRSQREGVLNFRTCLAIVGILFLGSVADAQTHPLPASQRPRLGFDDKLPQQPTEANSASSALGVVPVVFGEDNKPKILPPPKESPSPKSEKLPDPKSVAPARPNLLDLDLDQLGKIQVRSSTQANSNPNPTPTLSSSVAGATTINPTQLDSAQGSSVAKLLDRAASVSVRRTSAINLDPRVRGLNSNQTNASAGGMTQFRPRRREPLGVRVSREQSTNSAAVQAAWSLSERMEDVVSHGISEGITEDVAC